MGQSCFLSKQKLSLFCYICAVGKWATFIILHCSSIIGILFAQPSSSNKVYHQAYQKYYQKRYSEAIPLFEQAIKNHPNEDKMAYSCLGYSYYMEKLYEKAIKMYEYSLDHFPDINTGHSIRMLAFCYHQMGDYKKSLEYCELYEALISQLKKFNLTPKENQENEQTISYIKQKNQQELKSISIRNQLKSHPIAAKITPITILNDDTDDIAPCISVDESTLFFTSYRKREKSTYNSHSEQWDGNIYVSYSTNNGLTWSKPMSIHSNINTTNQEGPCALTLDGSTMYYYTWFEGTGGDIVESTIQNGVWSKPKRLPDVINTDLWESQPTISPDGNLLIFVRSEGYAKPSDLWYSVKDASGKWTPAKNMGSLINSEMSEMSPYLHIDGKTLYFSSNGHSTMGGYDIFKTTLLPDGTWSKPENVGYPINSEKDDQYFVLNASGTKAYLSSNRDSPNNKMNLYQIELPESFKTQNVTVITGTIKDELTDKPLISKIVVENMQSHKTQILYSNDKGKFTVVLPHSHKYGIKIEKMNYESKYAIFEVNKNFQFIKKMIKLRSIEKPGGLDLRKKDELSGF